MVKHLNENEFESEVLKKEGVVLVDFFATWCPPCKMLAPVLDEISNSRSIGFEIAKVNIDENYDLAAEYRIEVVPTMLVFKDGKVVDTLIGYNSKEDIVEKVSKHV